MPRARWFFTSPSIIERVMGSLPTTATVLSMYLYFCAFTTGQRVAASATVSNNLLIIPNK